MLTDKTHLVGGKGYCDPNREDQGYSFVPAPAMDTTIGKVIPRPDEDGSFEVGTALQFDNNSTNNTIHLSKLIDPINFAAHIKENTPMLPTEQLTKQLRGENKAIMHIDQLPYLKTDEHGHSTGLGLGTENSSFSEKLNSIMDVVDKATEESSSGGTESLEEALRKQAFQTFEGNRAQRRRARAAKQKATPKHVTNTQTKHVKAALGSVILGKLGQIQQDTTDSIKREVLKTMPLSRFAEVVGGKEIPEYQKRLLDLQQARAEGSLKPELSSLRDQSAKAVADGLKPLYDHTIETADRDSDIAEALYPTLVENDLTEAPIQ